MPTPAPWSAWRGPLPILRRLVRHHDLPAEGGVLVTAVEGESPAVPATLRDGDIIIGFAGEPVRGIDDLHRLLTAERIGVGTSITVLRGTSKLDLPITPGQMRARHAA